MRIQCCVLALAELKEDAVTLFGVGGGEEIYMHHEKLGYKIMVCEQVVAMVHSLNRNLVSPVLCFIDPRIASYCLVVYLRKGNTSHHTVSKNTQNQPILFYANQQT